jgi:hypothetical protein
MLLRSEIAAHPESIRDNLNRALALATGRAAEISEGRMQTERKKLQLGKSEIDLLERRVKLLAINRLDSAAHPATPTLAGGLSPENPRTHPPRSAPVLSYYELF